VSDERTYEICEHCDYFVDPNDCKPEEGITFAKYLHLDAGKEHEHEASPSGIKKTLGEWKEERPDLFVRFPDGLIGPNSEYFTHSLEERQ